MDDFPIETHPFAPVLPPHARVMMMGTFPPAAAKRCMAFHYPNTKGQCAGGAGRLTR